MHYVECTANPSTICVLLTITFSFNIFTGVIGLALSSVEGRLAQFPPKADQPLAGAEYFLKGV